MLPLVFADADVLYSATLRAWLFNLSTGGYEGEHSPAFDLLVTEAVIAESVSRWHDNNPRANGIITTRMAENLRTVATVVRDYDASIPFPGEDDGDIHVHAAAIAGQAGYLITFDRGFHDLPDDVKDELPYEIYHPDDFLMLASRQSTERLREITRSTVARYASKDGGDSKIVAKLINAGVPRFAEAVNEQLAFLAGARERTFNSRAERRLATRRMNQRS